MKYIFNPEPFKSGIHGPSDPHSIELSLAALSPSFFLPSAFFSQTHLPQPPFNETSLILSTQSLSLELIELIARLFRKTVIFYSLVSLPGSIPLLREIPPRCQKERLFNRRSPSWLVSSEAFLLQLLVTAIFAK